MIEFCLIESAINYLLTTTHGLHSSPSACRQPLKSSPLTKCNYTVKQPPFRCPLAAIDTQLPTVSLDPAAANVGEVAIGVLPVVDVTVVVGAPHPRPPLQRCSSVTHPLIPTRHCALQPPPPPPPATTAGTIWRRQSWTEPMKRSKQFQSTKRHWLILKL